MNEESTLGRAAAGPLAIAQGAPLDEEPGLGALTLPGLLREVTNRYAEREAMVFHRTDASVERWSYGDLWDQAMSVARALTACNIGRGSRVGVMMTNRPEWVCSTFGVGLAGGVAVPLSTFSTAAELEQLLQASAVSILLLEGRVLKKDFAAILRDLEPGIPEAAPGRLASMRFPNLRRLAVLGEESCGAMESWADFLAHGEVMDPAIIEERAAAVNPSDPGVIFFSSGSTGKPKGIVSAHRAVAIQCWRWRRTFALGDGVRAWSANGFFFSGNFAMALGSALSSGGSLVLQPTFDPVEALRLMQAERVTLPLAWPHQWAQLRTTAGWRDADLSSFKYVECPRQTGPHPTIAADWTEPRGAYGATETFTLVSRFASGSADPDAADNFGEVLPGNTIKIVDPLTGELVPLGARGEIAVKGPTLMLGYLGTPLDETLDNEGFYRTGDGGLLNERGRLLWEGRLNDIIKTGGANVSPLEVDGALLAHPGVKLSVTVGVPHETLGEIVVSCVVPKPGALVEEAGVREFIKARLASYKVPRHVLVVREDELSLTGSAKIRSNALRELAARRLQGAPLPGS